MSFFKEFKEFINQGDVMDMAVGIIIGGALTAIVTALTSDIIQPLINFITGGKAVVEGLVSGNGNRLRVVHQRLHQLPHHRLHRVLPCQGREQDEKHGQEGRCRARCPLLPVLPRGSQGGCDALSALRRCLRGSRNI